MNYGTITETGLCTLEDQINMVHHYIYYIFLPFLPLHVILFKIQIYDHYQIHHKDKYLSNHLSN